LGKTKKKRVLGLLWLLIAIDMQFKQRVEMCVSVQAERLSRAFSTAAQQQLLDTTGKKLETVSLQVVCGV
jgi:hypothetical protein